MLLNADRKSPKICGSIVIFYFFPRFQCFYHFISSIPLFLSSALTWLNGFDPRNHRCAERGLGCGDSIIQCFEVSMSFFLLCANDHQRTKMTNSLSSDILWMTKSVNAHQPRCWWLAASQSLTVSMAFKRSTPWFAQSQRSPLHRLIARSLSSSL